MQQTQLRARHLWHLLTAIGGAIAAVAVLVVIGKCVVLVELPQQFLICYFMIFMRKHSVLLIRVFLVFLSCLLLPFVRMRMAQEWMRSASFTNFRSMLHSVHGKGYPRLIQ